MAQNLCYALVEQRSDLEIPNLQTLKRDLERGTDDIKQEALEKIIIGTLNGEKYDSLLMHVIRFVMPTKNKKLKKLLLFYWEVCPKYNEDGKLKQETILICNALLNDLRHSNEYIRGATLRFLCRLSEQEILEPLVGPIRECLEHRHGYVRRNAVLAMSSIYKNLPHLIPDAPELIYSFLIAEPDVTCKRNALIFLQQNAPETAINWVMESMQVIGSFDAYIQLAIIEMIQRTFRSHSALKGKFIKIVFEMLQSPLGMVKFEAANTIVTLTSSAAVIKAAGTAYIQLITTESDNNVKLIALDHFDKLRERHGGILDDLAVDLLKVLSNSGIEVKNKCLKIVMVLTSQRNVNEVIGILKKELKDTMNSESEIAGEYRGLLVQTIHSCAASFPEIAEQVVKLFLGVISEFSTASAADAIAFMSEVTEKFPALRGELIKDLLSTLPEIKGSKALRMALWVLGEYSEDLETVMASWKCIMDEIGELPLLAQEMREQQGDMPDGGQDEYGERQTGSSSRRVLADGSYATESVLDTKASKTSTMLVKHNIRQLLLEGDYFVGVVLASVLTKLTLRLAKLNPQDTQLNSLVAQAMLVMVGVVRVGQSTFVPAPIDEDSYDRVLSCIKALEFMDDDYEDLQLAFLEESHDAFAKLIKAREEREMQTKEVSTKQVDTDISSPIEFRLLAPKGPANDVEDVDLVASELPENALGGSVTKLDNIVQLTGFSDPVYVETYLTVHQYDIVLDMLVVNQTNDTLRNVTIEFSMLGDLKLVEKPRSYNLAPRSFSSVKAVIKVSSTETGVIFGDLVYDGPSTSESHCIVFNDLHIDILEYIRPAFCDEAKFFSMWSEFEWENKINVLTSICDLRQYLDLLIKSTNMACLTPQSNLCDDIENDCGFLAANLYARSIFGEDSLMNVSLEKVGPTSPVTGHIRIRSKTQGIALSLGDKISQAQKLTLTKSHSQTNPPAQTPATPSFSSPLLA